MNKHRSKRPSKQSAQHSVRIISGMWRRRTLPVVDADGLRPTSDRIRETLFNWLAPHIEGARVLDLFAGTGALGLEALSRGAAFTQFIELNPNAAKQLRENLNVLNASRDTFHIEQQNALEWLSNCAYQKNADDRFDIIFVDPPFAKQLWSNCHDHIAQHIVAADDALIYVESPRDTTFETPNNWQNLKDLRAGQVSAKLFLNDRTDTPNDFQVESQATPQQGRKT